MFSYRHAFHAGNHGDVLKHCVLLQVLEYLKRKETAFWVIDTHAGAGLYDLSEAWARQTGEAQRGVRTVIERLQGQAPAVRLVERYVHAIEHFNPRGTWNCYPGSPALALAALRPQDRLHLFELHPTEIDVLHHNLERLQAPPKRVAVVHANGFTGLNALLPPAPRRGLVLIDPSYEDKADYRHVLQAVRAGLQRFAHGCYLVWYPLVQRVQVQDMVRALERLPVDWLHATLTVRQPAADGLGLHGSGVFLINPPYTLHDELRHALPWLVQALGQDAKASHVLRSSQTADTPRTPGRQAGPRRPQNRSPGRR